VRKNSLQSLPKIIFNPIFSATGKKNFSKEKLAAERKEKVEYAKK